MATTFAEALAPFVTDGSLKHYYPLNTAYQATDVVGSQDGAKVGTVTIDDDGAHFVGTDRDDNYISLGDHDDFSASTTGELTVLCQVTIEDWNGGDGDRPDYTHWMGKGEPNEHEWTFRHYQSGSYREGWVSFYAFQPDGGEGAGSRVLDPTNQPHPLEPTTEMQVGGCIVGTQFNGGRTYSYWNGQQTDTDLLSGYSVTPTNGTAPVGVGLRTDGSGSLIGIIRRVMFFDRKLTSTEIADLNDARNLPEGSWGGGAPSATFFASVRDSFESSVAAVWTDNQDGVWNAANGGECRLVTDTTSGNHIATGYGYVLQESAISFKMLPPVDLTGASNSTTFIRVRINDADAATADSRLQVLIYPVNDEVVFQNRIAGADETPLSGSATITYDSSEHVYFRIRETDGVVYFETSPDRVTWTVQRTDTTPAWMDDSPQRIYFDTQQTATVTYAVIDEVNVFPISALQDEFDTQDIAKWTFVGGATAGDGSLAIPGTGTTQFANGAITKDTYDLLDGDDGFTFRLLRKPTVGDCRLSVDLAPTYPTTANPPYTSAAAGLYFDTTAGGLVEANYVSGGTRTVLGTFTELDWYNIRRNGANVEFRTAVDNGDQDLVWNVVETVAVSSLPTLTGLYAIFRGRGSATEGQWEVDSVGLVPLGDNPPTAPTSVAAEADEESLVMTWAAPADDGGQAVTEYVVSWGTNQVTLDASTLTYRVTGLTGGVPATVCVKARNSVGFSADACVTETPLIAPPPASTPSEPLNVAGTAGNKTVSLTWDEPDNMNGTFDRYEVYLDDGTLVATSIDESATVRQLVNGVPYRFQVAAVNENGRGALSPPTEPLVPFVVGDLADTSAFGAWTAQRGTLETAIGQYLQPVVVEVPFGSTDLSEAATLAAAGRTPAIVLDMAGSYTSDVIANESDDYFLALGEAIEALAVPVVVVPYYLANDWRMPWSPLYQVNAPNFDYSLSCYTENAEAIGLAFDRVARVVREKTSYARFGWLMSVDPQQNDAGNQWTDYYPTDPEVVDIIGLFGANYGVGPIQGKAGQTAWREHYDVFDTAYTAAVALDDTAPIWLVTACHEPSEPWAVGDLPGFAPDAVVLADATKSKQDWIDALMFEDAYTRVQAVVWYDLDGVRKWSLEAADTAILRDYVPGGGTWDQSTIAHPENSGAATIVDKTNALAAWGEDWTNTYDRPDAKDGSRISVVYGVPGSAITGTRTTTEMLKWNRLHGLLLRQLARYGMVGHAFQVGDIPVTSPYLLAKGTTTAGEVAFDATWDDTPGLTTQEAGGMVNPTGGSEL